MYMLNMIPLNDESDHAVCGGEWRCSTLDKPLILDPAQTPQLDPQFNHQASFDI